MNYNKKTLIALLTIITIFSTYVGLVMAGTGSIRIHPALPYMNESPTGFTIWVQGTTTAFDPIILLVMTDSSYQGLTPPVTVTWGSSGSATLGPWTDMSTNGAKIPDFASNGAAYTVASLKDHLETSEKIWYAWAPILDGDIVPGEEPYKITVHMDSTKPEMLVYIMGKSDSESAEYDMAIPPTIPGFVIPEVPLGTVLSLVTMLGTAGLYKLKRK